MKNDKQLKKEIALLVIRVIWAAAIALGMYYYYIDGYKAEWLGALIYVSLGLYGYNVYSSLISDIANRNKQKASIKHKAERQYEIGDKICLVKVQGEPSYNWAVGTIESIDEHGKLRGTWGNIEIDPSIDEITHTDYIN